MSRLAGRLRADRQGLPSRRKAKGPATVAAVGTFCPAAVAVFGGLLVPERLYGRLIRSGRTVRPEHKRHSECGGVLAASVVRRLARRQQPRPGPLHRLVQALFEQFLRRQLGQV